MKKCPYCAEEIQDEAILCRYCGSKLDAPPPLNNGPQNLPPPLPFKASDAKEVEEQDDGKKTIRPIDAGIYLPEGEFCYFAEKCNLYEEKKVTKRVSFHGPTLRLKILPGIFYRAGNLGVGKKSKFELVKVDNGILYITSARIIFSGSINNKTIDYKDVLDFVFHGDGIEIVKGSGTNQYFELKKKTFFATQLIQHFVKNKDPFA